MIYLFNQNICYQAIQDIKILASNLHFLQILKVAYQKWMNINICIHMNMCTDLWINQFNTVVYR